MNSDNDILVKTSRLICKVGVDVSLSVKKSQSERNFLFVEKTNEGFCLSYNNKLFLYPPVIRRAFLLHECFHIIQYLENFPMLLHPNKKGNIFLVQNIIADLYVSKNMRAAGFEREAKSIFNIQVKNIEKLLKAKSSQERILRLVLMLSEASFFEKCQDRILKKLKGKLTINEQKKVTEINAKVAERYSKNDIYGMYEAIIKYLFPKYSLCSFDNMIIVQEKKCLK